MIQTVDFIDEKTRLQNWEERVKPNFYTSWSDFTQFEDTNIPIVEPYFTCLHGSRKYIF